MILTVACVLRSGGCYDPAYVHRLRDRVEEHLSREHRFVCLTDMEVEGVRTKPLTLGWPGYWSKLELFRPGVFTGRVLYLDLDTEIVGSLDDLASYHGPFAMIDDWRHPWLGASAVMAWDAGWPRLDDIWEPFVRHPEGAMGSHRGDQNWISGSVEWQPLRELYPGQIVSRWEECSGGVPDGARVVCFHGTPRPHVIDWALTGSREEWRERTGDESHLIRSEA